MPNTSIKPRIGGAGRARPVRVMIVDDSLIVRTVLSRVIEPEPDIEIVAKSGSAELAIAQLARTPADVVLLDLEMPGMGGLEALPRILAATSATQVLVVSSLTEAGAEHTLAALAMGAADTMLKPRAGEFDDDYRRALIGKIRALGSSEPQAAVREPSPTPPPVAQARRPGRAALIAIGASTGGIHALSIFLRSLPRSVTVPILVTQHLPPSFTAAFARQLQIASGRDTIVARDGMVIESGRIYVASGDGHMIVEKGPRGLRIGSDHGKQASGCTPSVDPLFASLARASGPETLAIVLSGMGRDGSIGAVDLAAAGGTIMVQDRASSAVWGMPGTVAEAGLASAVLPPEQLAQRAGALAGSVA